MESITRAAIENHGACKRALITVINDNIKQFGGWAMQVPAWHRQRPH
jgi:hypothetical protein